MLVNTVTQILEFWVILGPLGVSHLLSGYLGNGEWLDFREVVLWETGVVREVVTWERLLEFKFRLNFILNFIF